MEQLFLNSLRSAILAVIILAMCEQSIPSNQATAVKLHPTPLHRYKRTALRDHNRFYRYGIVPYTFHRAVNNTQRHIIRQTMEHFHHTSCVRFVPRISRDGQWARDLYRLGHGGYIQFIQTDTCFSGPGNNNRKTMVSCCGRRECKHELGHALGLIHEHQNPRRDGFIRINDKHIPPGQKLRYMKRLPEEVLGELPFDISSPMGYDYKRFPATEISLLTTDLNTNKKDFYMLREIANIYQCRENNCSQISDPCFHDGYMTLIHNECQCNCPQGLDVETNCRTTLSQATGENSCGGVFNLDAGNPSVTFSKPASQTQECIWLINAPTNHTIVMDFDTFNVSTFNGECEDSVEVRHSLLGQEGNYFCGSVPPSTTQSYFNRVMVIFSPSIRPRPISYFSATARLVSHQNLCYNPDDKGMTYDGTVNFTRDFTTCIDWSLASHCPHSPYNVQELRSALVKNYCRNPGNGVRPWCYVQASTCDRKYCDVCALDRPVDTKQDCATRISSHRNCTHNSWESKRTCAKTCESYLFPPQTTASNITCAHPGGMGDSDQVDKLNQTIFAVGEFITFRCRHMNRLFRTEYTKFCLSSGAWSPGNTACLPCDQRKGQVLHGDSCYAVQTQHRTANQHQRRCQQMGGQLADVRSLPEQQFVTDLAYAHGAAGLYIGPNDMYKEDYFRFRDFTPVTWTNWGEGSSNGRAKDCVWSRSDNLWMVSQCNRRLQAVCKIPMLRHRRLVGVTCSDARDDCGRMLQADPSMCSREQGDFAMHQCPLTCRRCL